MMKIGIETESLHLWLQNRRMDIFGFIEQAAAAGYDGVMINIIEKKNQTEGLGALGAPDRRHLEAVAHALRRFGLFAELDTRGTSAEHIRRVLEIADILGADTVRTFVMSGQGYSHGNLVGSFDPEQFKRAGEEIAGLVPMLERYRIRLGIENHEIETVGEILSLVEAIKSPWIGIHFDVGNAMMAWEDPVEAAVRAAPYVVSTHMKDHIVCMNREQQVICGVPLGDGNIDLTEVVRILYSESTLSRLVIEMCYPYASPFQRKPGTGGVYEMGQGAFMLREPPYPDICPLDYYLYEGEQLEKMLQDQLDGMRRSGRALRDICRSVEEELRQKERRT